MQSETAKTLKNSAGRVETPTNGQDIREAVRAKNTVIYFCLRKGADVKRQSNMKKILVILVALIGFGFSANAQTAKGISAQVVIDVADCYDKMVPNAEYSVRITKDNQTATVYTTSCNRAINATISALEKGADEVTISPEITTIHPSCRSKTYKKSDLPELRKK
jgi:hypothetical protein